MMFGSNQTLLHKVHVGVECECDQGGIRTIVDALMQRQTTWNYRPKLQPKMNESTSFDSFGDKFGTNFQHFCKIS